jgi:hypothetical protein
MAALFGGGWYNASYAGAFYWYLAYAASTVISYVGARVAFK